MPAFPEAGGRTGLRRGAESVSVLCGEYSSTLRKVQSGTPHDVHPFCRSQGMVGRMVAAVCLYAGAALALAASI